MNQHPQNLPAVYPLLLAKCKEIGFTMPSDIYIGTLLKTLVASKPGGRFLELGTGIGLSLSWMVDGMDHQGHIISIDNDPGLVGWVREYLDADERVEILCEAGETWLTTYQGPPFDLIFADAWPGKYGQLEETLALIKPGGLYVIDDMDAQPNWPDGHQEKVNELMATLESRTDLTLTKLDWSTGVILAVKK